jgi:heat shock protein HslJ
MEMKWVKGPHAAVFIACLALTACGETDASGGDVSLEQLEGSGYSSTEIREDGADRPLASDVPITLTFTEDGISANAGCNTLFGGVSITDNRLIVNQALASSMMMCDEALMDQDQWLNSILTGSPRISVTDDVLTLETEDTTITFEPAQ